MVVGWRCCRRPTDAIRQSSASPQPSLPERAFAEITTPAPTSRRHCWSPARSVHLVRINRSALCFDGECGLELDGHDIVLGKEGGTLATASRPPPPSISQLPTAHRPSRCYGAAVQHLDRDAVPPHSTIGARLRAGRAGGSFPLGLIMIDDRWSVQPISCSKSTLSPCRIGGRSSTESSEPKKKPAGRVDGSAGGMRWVTT